MAIVPGAPSTLYAATSRGGVFKTTNGGASWSPVNSGLDGLAALGVLSLAIDPTAPDTVYAGTGSGLYKTTTGGASWSLANTGLTSVVNALAIDPMAPATSMRRRETARSRVSMVGRTGARSTRARRTWITTSSSRWRSIP